MGEPDLNTVGPALPALARAAIERWSRGEKLALERASVSVPAPVFVTLRDARGELRGCIGTLAAATPDVRDETARAAVLAAGSDPRFGRVQASELGGLTIEVSVLMPATSVSALSELDPARYGVIVRDNSGRRGVLLPDVPGVGGAEDQVSIARRKAGIPAGVSVTLERFEVRKFIE